MLLYYYITNILYINNTYVHKIEINSHNIQGNEFNYNMCYSILFTYIYIYLGNLLYIQYILYIYDMICDDNKYIFSTHFVLNRNLYNNVTNFCINK